MKRIIAGLMCGAMLSSFIFCGCTQTTQTGTSSGTESQTEATTTAAETEPAEPETEAGPHINADNMTKVTDLYASKHSQGIGTEQIFVDGIRGKGVYYVEDGDLVFCYSSLNGMSKLEVSFNAQKVTAAVIYDFNYKGKHIRGMGNTGIATFEKLIDDVISDNAPYVFVTDKSGLDDYSENLKKDLPIVYSRFIAMADNAFPQLGLKLEDIGVYLGTKYRSVDPKQATSMESASAPVVHQFKNGFCTDCKKAWTEHFYNVMGEVSGKTGKGWRSEYSQPTQAKLSAEDLVQFSTANKNYACMRFFQQPGDLNAEDEDFVIEADNRSTKKKKSMNVTMIYNLSLKKMEIREGVYGSKYSYHVTIKAKPGQYDKVFESKESLKKYVTVDFFITNKNGTGTSAWGKKANISKLKETLAKEGCTYYTKDEVIDRLWEHHENFLESIEFGMNDIDLSLADIGVNWKK